ncbi:hypothetical protein FJY71_10230 [candidate division WOR-3 bacterium]|nr:hypothetical protein [candidate division WOR-3 bacterium]
MIRALATALLAAACLLPACSRPDYFPDREGTTWEYESADSRPAYSWRVCGRGRFGADSVLCRRVAVWEEEMADTLGLLKSSDRVVLFGFMSGREGDRMTLLRLPLGPGARWPFGTGAETTWAEFRGYEDVETPAGRFPGSARVTYTGSEAAISVWFAPGTGIVQLSLDTSFYGPEAFAGQPRRLVLKSLTPGR